MLVSDYIISYNAISEALKNELVLAVTDCGTELALTLENTVIFIKK